MTLTAPIESVVVLSRAIDQTGDVMSLVHEDQLALPTPCGDWDVARLLAHLVAMPRNFVEMADGIEVDWMAEPEPVTVGWTADFRSLADDLIHFWHQRGGRGPAAGGLADRRARRAHLGPRPGHRPLPPPRPGGGRARPGVHVVGADPRRTAASPSAPRCRSPTTPRSTTGSRPSPAAPPDLSLPVAENRADPSVLAPHMQPTRHFLRQEVTGQWVLEDQR